MATINGVWVFNDTLSYPTESITQSVNFTSRYRDSYVSTVLTSTNFSIIAVYTSSLAYFSVDHNYYATVASGSTWRSDSPKTITFTEQQEVTDDFYTWLTANATKQGGDEEMGETSTSIAEKLITVAENVPKVYAAGQVALEKAFTANWTRYYYAYGFMQQDWSGFTFSKPLVPSGSIYNIFSSYKGEYLPKNIDLSKALVTGTDAARLFYYASNLLEVDCMGLKAGAELSSAFRGCEKMKKITGLNSNESNTFSSTFLECYALEEIEINGVIGTDISFPHSPLTVACMNSIIACLKDYSGSETTHTLTFKSDRLALLSDAEKAIATEKGWTLV